MGWGSKDNRPKDTIGRILASAPPGTVEITQTKKPRNLLTPWVSREKELKVVFHPDDTTMSQPSTTLPRPLMPSSPPSYTSATDPARQVAAQGENGGFPGPGVAQAGVISGVGMAALYCAKFAYEYYSAPEVKKEEKKWIWEN